MDRTVNPVAQEMARAALEVLKGMSMTTSDILAAMLVFSAIALLLEFMDVKREIDTLQHVPIIMDHNQVPAIACAKV